MSKSFKKIIASGIAVIYLISTIMTSSIYAAPSDISGHPAATIINKWISKGLAGVQADGYFRPKEVIDRIEFVTFINKVFNFTEKASINFADVITGSEDGIEIARAVAAGYLQGDAKKKVYPYQPILKADAAVMLAKVFELKASNTGIINNFSDSAKIPAASREAICALVERGYMTAGADGIFSPWTSLTRADAIVLIDKIMGGIINSSGTYNGNFKGNVVVNTQNITLRDAVIDGNLYLTAGIGDGDVTFDKVTVKGKTIIRGGGKNSIFIRNSTLWGPVAVAKKTGLIRLVAEGNTNVYSMELNSGAVLQENGINETTVYKGFGEVQINAGVPAKQEFKFEGGFSTINIEAASVNIQVNGNVGKLLLNEKGENNSIKLNSGNVNEFFVQAGRTIAELTGGTVSTFRVFDTAEGSRVKVDGTTVSAIDVKASTYIDITKGLVTSLVIDKAAAGSYINIASTARVTTLTNNGNATITGTNSGTYIPSVYLSVQNIAVAKNSATASKVTVVPSDAQLSFTSLNTSVVTVNSSNGMVTGVTTGTAVIVVTASKPGYVASSSTYTVTVNDSIANITAAGSLAVNPATGYTNTTNATISLSYTPGELLSNGIVEFTMPSGGFTVIAGDQIVLPGGTTININGTAQTHGTHSVTISGRAVRVTGVTCAINQSVVLRLVNKTIPAVGSYTFSAAADSDGTGTRAISAASTAVFTSSTVPAAATATLGGTLAVAPSAVSAGTVRDITLTYTAGERLNNGTVLFTIPSGITPNASDPAYINNITASAITVSGQTFTVTGATATTGQTIVVILKNKTMPAAGSYNFSAVSDADGAATAKTSSPGTGSERQTLSVSTVPTLPGTLEISIASAMAGTSSDITMTYTPGENLSGSSVVFSLPAGFTAQTGDRASIGGGTEVPLTSGWITSNGRNVTINDVSATTGESIVLNLINKTIPAAGTYSFSAAADADGAGTARTPSNGNGTETKVFTSVAVASALNTPANYSVPVPGTSVGTTKIAGLSLAGISGATGWQYAVQNTTFGSIALDSTITGASIYTSGNPINVTAGQHLLLAAVDGSGRVKACMDMIILAEQIRPENAAEIGPESYSIPVPGSVPGSAMISILNLPAGSHKWQIKVQNSTLSEVPFLDGTMQGTVNYTQGSDINVSAGQYVILLAVDNSGKIKAYRELQIASGQIRNAAAVLIASTNYSVPVPGAVQGTTKISALSAAGISGLPTKWKYAVTGSAISIPALDGIYPGAQDYTTNAGISINPGQHLILLATDDNDYIKAYADITVSAAHIKPLDAITLNSPGNYSIPVAGSAPGTTRIVDLNLLGLTGATRWKVIVQAGAITTPVLDSIPAGAVSYTKGTDINIAPGQHLILLATDDMGRIKAYADLVLGSSNIKAPLATPLVLNGNYEAPVAGSMGGTTKIEALSFIGLSGIPDAPVKWQVAVQDNAFVPPSYDSTFTGTLISDNYTAGTNISANAGQHLLLLATNSDGKIKGYVDIHLTAGQIKAPNAAALTSPGNYSIPVAGSAGGTTKIGSLSFIGLPAGATKWKIVVQSTVIGTLELDSTVNGATDYTANTDIPVTSGQALTILATDNSGKVKAFASMIISGIQIRTTAAVLVSPSDYSIPVQGSMVGMTKITTLGAITGAAKWQIKVQNEALSSAPLKDNVLSGAADYTENSDIPVAAGQHLILLATDSNGGVKAYADITIAASQIRQVTADLTGSAVSSPVSETDIISGGKSIIVTLAYGQWASDIITNTARRNALIDGLAASTEIAEWAKVITALKADTGSVIRDSNTQVTILLPETSNYNILGAQSITLTVPASLITGAAGAVTATPVLQVLPNISATISGTVISGGFSEADIIAGGKTIIVTLASGQWTSDVAADPNKINALFDGFTALTEVSEWAKVVTALKTAGPAAIVRNSSTKLTVTLPAVAGYHISASQAITLRIPKEVISGAISNVNAAPGIQILPLTSAAPSIASITAAEGGVSEAGLGVGDTLTIVFDTATNKTGVTYSDKTAVDTVVNWNGKSFGSSYTGAWISNTTLVVTCTGATGATYNLGDSITIKAGANIKTANGFSPASTAVSGPAAGTFDPVPAIASITASEGGTLEAGLGAGDKLTIVFNVATNKTATVTYPGQGAVDEVIDWNGKSFGTSYTGAWTDNKTLVITCSNSSGASFTTGDTIIIKSGANIRSLSGTSAASNAVSAPCTGTFDPIALISGVSSPAFDGTYGIGAVIPVTVTFNSAVDVNASAGSPMLRLETGTVDRDAVYTGGSVSGVTSLTFNYTVQAGDAAVDLGYKDVNSLVLNGAEIKTSGTGTDAAVLLPVLGTGSSLNGQKALVIETIAPVNASTYPKAGTKTSNTVNIQVQINENGKAYYVVLAGGAPAPTALQVKSGTGDTVITGGSITLTANTAGTMVVSGLSMLTAYDIYVVCEDAAQGSNIQATVAKIPVTTLGDTVPPSNIPGYPLVTTVGGISAAIEVQTNEAGKAYYIVVAGGATAPSAASVKAGTGALAGTSKGSVTLTSSGSGIYAGIINVTGLSGATPYDIYVASDDSAANLQTSASKVSVTTDLSAVAVDVAAGKLLNTSTKMEYSINSVDGYDGTWKVCTNGTTSVGFAAGRVYVRYLNFKSNFRLVTELTMGDPPSNIIADEAGGAGAIVLRNVDLTMEFTKNGASASPVWYPVTAGIMAGQALNLSTAPNDDLRVRYKVTPNSLASKATGRLNNTGLLTVSQQAAVSHTVIGRNQTVQLSDLWKLTASKEGAVLNGVVVDCTHTNITELNGLALMYSANTTIGDSDDIQLVTGSAIGLAEVDFTGISKSIAMGSAYIYVMGQVNTASSSASISLSIDSARVTATGATSNRLLNRTGTDMGTVITVDNTAPTAAITFGINRAVKQGETMVITATFSKAMESSTPVKVSISGANTVSNADMTRVDATHYTYLHTVGSGNGDADITLSNGRDLSGNNVDAAPVGGGKFVVDNTPPAAAPISSVQAMGGTVVTNIINSSNTNLGVVFNIGNDMVGGMAEVLMDGNPFGTPVRTAGPITSGTTSVTLNVPRSSIPSGNHTFRVKLTDAAGNESTSDPSAMFTADYTVPEAPTVSYTVHGDNVVPGYFNNTNTRIDFSVNIAAGDAAGGTLELLMGATVLAARSVTASDGTISFTVLKADLGAEGSKNFTARLTDAAGNNISSAAVSMTADFTSPGSPIVASATGNDNIKIEGCINGTNSQIIASADIARGEAAGGKAELLIDDSSFAVRILDSTIGTNDATVSLLSAFANVTALRNAIDTGDHSIKVRLYDAAGNYADSAELSLTADYTSPSKPYNANIRAAGGNQTMGHINASNNSIAVDVDIRANQVTGGYAELIMDGNPLSTPLIIASNIDASADHLSKTFNLADLNEMKTLIPAGSHNFAVKIYTIYGNYETSDNITLVADYTAPAAATAITVSGTGGRSTAGYLNGTNSQLSAAAKITAGQATGGKAEILIDGIVVGTYNIGSSDSNIVITTSYSTISALQLGIPDSGTGNGQKNYSVILRITDAAGNRTSSAAVALKVDYTPPEEPVTFTIGASGGTLVAGRINETNMYVKATGVVIQAGQATGGKAELIMDKGKPGQRTIATDSIINATDTSLTLNSNFTSPLALQTAIPEGDHDFVIVLYDAAGNSVETAPVTLAADYN